MKKWSQTVEALFSYFLALFFPDDVPARGLEIGDKAPDFSLAGSDGHTYSLSQLQGKTVVLAWFPKAFTGG